MTSGMGGIHALATLRVFDRLSKSIAWTEVAAEKVHDPFFVGSTHHGVALNVSRALSFNKLLGAGNSLEQLPALRDWDKGVLIAMKDQHRTHTQVGGVIHGSNFGCTNSSE